MGSPEAPTTPGRPRSVAADAAILDAAIELLAEHGYDGMSVEAVAARAGVGKATIYRRYDSKAELLIAAMTHAKAAFGEGHPDTGNYRADLRAAVERLVRMLRDSDVGRCLPAMLVARGHSASLGAADEEIVQGQLAQAKRRARAAVERGEIRDDVDLGILVDLVSGAVFYRAMISREPLDDRFVDRLVDTVLRGFGT